MKDDRTREVLDAEERQILREVCDDVGISLEAVERMIVVEDRLYGMGRRHGIWEALDSIVTFGLQESSKSGDTQQ